jgi:hypothetical protein
MKKNNFFVTLFFENNFYIYTYTFKNEEKTKIKYIKRFYNF